MIGSATFRYGDNTYRAGRLSTFDQLELATTCREAFFSLSIMAKQIEEKGLKLSESEFSKALCGFLGNLPRDTRDDAVKMCLTVVYRGRGKNNTHWDPLYSSGQLMFTDLDLEELLKITYEVVKHNGLIRFFSVSPVDGENSGTMESNSQS